MTQKCRYLGCDLYFALAVLLLSRGALASPIPTKPLAVPHLPPGCSRRAGGKRPWGVREWAGAGTLTQNVPLGSRVVSQKVNFLGQGNKGGSSRLPLGEE